MTKTDSESASSVERREIISDIVSGICDVGWPKSSHTNPLRAGEETETSWNFAKTLPAKPSAAFICFVYRLLLTDVSPTTTCCRRSVSYGKCYCRQVLDPFPLHHLALHKLPHPCKIVLPLHSCLPWISPVIWQLLTQTHPSTPYTFIKQAFPHYFWMFLQVIDYYVKTETWLVFRKLCSSSQWDIKRPKNRWWGAERRPPSTSINVLRGL